MIPISGLIQMALNFFEIDIVVFDYTYKTESGEEVRTLSEERTIQGAVDPSNSKTMERIFGESMSAGDIMVITSQTLYIFDAFTTDEEKIQSIVTFKGNQYRVSNSADWDLIAGVTPYLCKRYLPQDAL